MLQIEIEVLGLYETLDFFLERIRDLIGWRTPSIPMNDEANTFFPISA